MQPASCTLATICGNLHEEQHEPLSAIVQVVGDPAAISPTVMHKQPSMMPSDGQQVGQTVTRMGRVTVMLCSQ